jgi:putative ABC transport system permease protein
VNISVTENMRLATTAVWTHRFRSLLTILGIVIGITTVVTVASLLTGLRAGVVTFFDELGPDNIFLFRTSGDPNQDNRIPKEAKRRPLKAEYADDIKRLCSFVQDVGIE